MNKIALRWDDPEGMEHGPGRKGETVVSHEGLALHKMTDAGYRIKVLHEAAQMAFRVIVGPEFESGTAVNEYKVFQAEWVRCPWHNRWWARLVRWLLNRSLLATWFLPDWLKWLCYAREPCEVAVKRKLPPDTLDRVRAQRCQLILRGEKPSKVLVGRRAMFMITGHPDLWKADSGVKYSMDRPGESVLTMLGMEVVVSPWLREDAVVVI